MLCYGHFYMFYKLFFMFCLSFTSFFPMHITYKIRVSKGYLQLIECQIAQNRDYFCDFGRKLENLSMPVNFYEQVAGQAGYAPLLYS